ncbi:MAG: XisH family protein [Desmonostoc vinosum HA7617-LM4]|nr:XisH family protein [Desmonostoc vinosum HA7617-LM4]
MYELVSLSPTPERDLYLAVSEATYSDIFTEPIGKLAIAQIPLKLIIRPLAKVGYSPENKFSG